MNWLPVVPRGRGRRRVSRAWCRGSNVWFERTEHVMSGGMVYLDGRTEPKYEAVYSLRMYRVKP